MRLVRTFVSFVLFIFCLGCTEHYVHIDGSHVANYAFKAKARRYIVWSTHSGGRENEPTVTSSITQYLHTNQQTVVERSRVDEVLREQHFRLRHTGDHEADLLRVGKLVGADQIIFADSTHSSASGGYLVSVRVRAVDVESATVLWSGSARVTDPINNVDQVLAAMPWMAMHRALCPVEVGYKWSEYGENGGGGCRKD